jgi:NTE family protein
LTGHGRRSGRPEWELDRGRDDRHLDEARACQQALERGVVSELDPISHAVELGAERIYVLPTGHACALQESPRGALAVALHAISLLTQRRPIDDIERHRDAARLIVLPPPCPPGIQPIDFGHADELIGRVLSDAREFLDAARPDSPPAVTVAV